MFQADPPDKAKIPADDAVGVTVVLITASYREQEFVRVGYYVTNEYEDPEMRENPPDEPQFDKLVRTIAANEPRVTKFKINWDTSAQAAANAAAETTAMNSENTNNIVNNNYESCDASMNEFINNKTEITS
jgi:histone chaperone ASF1